LRIEFILDRSLVRGLDSSGPATQDGLEIAMSLATMAATGLITAVILIVVAITVINKYAH
jgi:hypothetical protein